MGKFAESDFHLAAQVQKVVPLLTFHSIDAVRPQIDVLLEADVRCVEIALRTPVAVAALALVSAAYPEVLVAAGTVWNERQWRAAEQAGARALISPGATCELIELAATSDIPWLPAGQTVSELGTLCECGYETAKFFPAQLSGGIEALRSIRAVLPGLTLCPSGGLNEANYQQYLAELNVAWVAGSWRAESGTGG